MLITSLRYTEIAVWRFLGWKGWLFGDYFVGVAQIQSRFSDPQRPQQKRLSLQWRRHRCRRSEGLTEVELIFHARPLASKSQVLKLIFFYIVVLQILLFGFLFLRPNSNPSGEHFQDTTPRRFHPRSIWPVLSFMLECKATRNIS